MKTEDRKAAEDFVAGLFEYARADILPKMEQSAFVLGVMGGTGGNDLFMALQIGLALTLDKPLILIVPPGSWVAPRLRSVARAVIEGDTADSATKEKLRVLLTVLMKELAPQ
jgi:hypothetical protein